MSFHETKDALDTHLFRLVVVSRHQSKVIGHGAATLVRQCPSTVIRHPAVNASPARVNPKDVLEPEVLPEPSVHHLDLCTRSGDRRGTRRDKG